MKIALHSASAPEWTLEELLVAARRYGCEGLELRAGIGHGHGAELAAGFERRKQLKKQADRAGVALRCLSVSCRFSDAADAETHVAETEAYVRLAEDLGIPCVRVFCGRIPPGGSLAESKRSVVDSLRSLAPSARRSGVVLLLETHDDWSDPRVMAGVLEAISDDHVGVLWDVLHTQLEGGASPDAAYAALAPWIRHVHVHDGAPRSPGAPESNGSGRHPDYRPIGLGVVDHSRILDLLRAGAYEGYLSGEWYGWEPADVHLPRELPVLSGLLAKTGGAAP
ncbi:sugar phosphate isomerase/epimerase [Cohnella sp. AR92]|uniref:sugar phosphate isomerase/epimerase family protein n=1 Tax=Cohnella sp. AR92 TaxID=648716 RepID=UPI000F8DD9C7|nr:sugar phosphate isomerase/epimerase family protein [Cohnella sp. AR92]RUS48532.1 sugar phosphate isomerase/epimerase [Cohnella sp. AR92]